MTFYIIIFLVAFVLMARAGSNIVRSLTYFSRFLNLPEFTVAFILMSAATTIPELFIGISSALNDIPLFSFGNILGANIINITLVVGLVTILNNGIRVESKISHKNFLFIFFLAVLPILLGFDGVISRSDGLILILFFIIYIFLLIREKEYFSKGLDGIKFDTNTISRTFKNITNFFVGILILIVSASLLVWSGKSIASAFSISIFSFGIIFVAIGTQLPELMFGIRASMLKHSSMSIGNSMGSVAFNSAFILGIVSIIRPISVPNNHAFFIAAAFLIAVLFLFNVFIYTRSNISRREGVILIALYIAFIAAQYALQIIG